MIWVYAVIMAVSAGLGTYVLARSIDRLVGLFGIPNPSFDILTLAAFMSLTFLMVAQAPAMMLIAAFVLWLAGWRNHRLRDELMSRFVLIAMAVLLGLAALDSPQFQLPEQLPKAAVMGAVYIVWVVTVLLPVGAPSEGLIASYAASVGVFVIGATALSLPLSIAGDAIIVIGAVVGALCAMTSLNAHHGLAGQWVFLYLLGFLAASSAYHGAWWLGLLGIAPVTVYTLLRRV